MKIQYTPKFKKQYKKLPAELQKQFDERLMLFVENPTNPVLRGHPLKGSYSGYWSMNINGDLRAIYLHNGDAFVIFALIGTHSQLYG
jgi:addiction module RelE/StbE family toxin